jgi:hypothetical protein
MLIPLVTFVSLDALLAAGVELARQMENPEKRVGMHENTSFGIDALGGAVIRDVDGRDGICTIAVHGQVLYLPMSRRQFLDHLGEIVKKARTRASLTAPLRGPAS